MTFFSVRPERVEGFKNFRNNIVYDEKNINNFSLQKPFSIRPFETLRHAQGERLGKQYHWVILALSCVASLTPLNAVDLHHQSSLSERDQMHIKQFYANKPVLVTGGCGFIGSHIVEQLVSYGARVTIIDDLSAGFEKNIAPFQDQVTLIQKSIVDPAACDEAVAGNEVIFHLAAFTSVPGSVNDPKLCHKVNVNGTFNLLQAARTHNVKRFVFSSTSSVYGVREDICRETDTHLEPVSPYGATKLMGELYCKQFSLLFDVPCVMLRYFNVHGPRQNPHSQYAAVVAKFQYLMERNEPILIFGNGQQTRDFVHVKDVAQANLLVGMAPQNIVEGQCFNIGTGKSISVMQLLQDMKQMFPEYTRETIFKPARDGDVMHTQMSAAKFNTLKEKVLG